MQVRKKDKSLVPFDDTKIINAIRKSAERVLVSLTEEQEVQVCSLVRQQIIKDIVTIEQLHKMVEQALDKVAPKVAKSYRDYRNYKTDFVTILDKVFQKSQSLRYIADRSNANTDSALVPTQRSLIYSELNGELYKKFFLNAEEREAMKEGYIYIHDRSARLDTFNCCIFDVANVLKGGFEMGNVWYNEPKSLDVAFDVISDIAMTSAASQYGGWTAGRVDSILAPYAEKSYQKYYAEHLDSSISLCKSLDQWPLTDGQERELERKADEYATKKVYRDFEQGFQSWEYRFNTVGSSRGDYPFIAVSFGVGTSKWEQMATEVILKVREKGQGAEGFKKPVLFPKLTFLYDKNLHGPGKQMEYLFDIAVHCSSKCMYPDFLSLSGSGYIPSMYKKYGEVVSLMGKCKCSPYKICRTLLKGCA